MRREVDIETEKYIGAERVRQHVTEEMHLSRVTCRAALSASCANRDLSQIFLSEDFLEILYIYFNIFHGDYSLRPNVNNYVHSL